MLSTIMNLQKIEGTWYFTVSDDEGAHHYKTDKIGDGLWVKDYFDKDWSQVRGTCDFSLRGMSRSGAYKKIRREVVIEL